MPKYDHRDKRARNEIVKRERSKTERLVAGVTALAILVAPFAGVQFPDHNEMYFFN